ncbi:glycosyltransferase [Chryseobacterium indologenes]|uniref:glycosyltransferase n=1 Tax=Chryseobacterium indologenes TaxID=253 RepID=UPI0009A233DE|nr:glycosyltransferase [Chryseobacterium indologenes]
MKKIAYIEIDTHAEIAQAFMDIMEGSQDFAVDYYFSKRIKDQVSHRHEAVFLSDSSMILDQLKGKGYDLVVIGTVHRYFNTFLAITKKYNAAVISHNLNFIKASKLDLMKSVFKGDVIFRLKLWLKEGLFYKTKVYQTSRSLFVLDAALISERYQLLPLFYTRDFDKTKNENLVVVIPGGVSQKRRDYHYIFETIQNLHTDQSCKFIFLGKASGHELKQLQHLSEKLPENIHITYFSERVSSEDFEQWMKKADVLWCPIQQDTEFFSMKEAYGQTKMTGNLGDAIAYGKLAVFPKNYPSKSDFIIPEKENILEQLKALSDTPFDFYTTYSKKEVQQKMEQFLQGLI